MKTLTNAVLISTFIFVTGCVSTQETNSSPNTSVTSTSEIPVEDDHIIFNHSANGKIYRIHIIAYIRGLRAHQTYLSIVSGKPFNGSLSEDAEAQNTIRDAFRKKGICGEGLHPGMLQLRYQYIPKFGTWAGYVRCSEKRQANI